MTYGVLTWVIWITMKSWLTRLKRITSWYYLINIWDFFISVELEEDNGQSFHTNVMVRDVLATMRAKGVCLGHSSISHWMNLRSWQGLLCWPSLVMQGPPRRHIALLANHPNWPQNNVTKYDALMWIWSKNAINDDGIFITSWMNSTIVDKI